MSIVKSFSVGNGDMFYIKHNTDNFTIIDCCMDEGNRDGIVDDLLKESKEKTIKRFISTHPDEDHLRGLKFLDQKMPIVNFYCTQNEATKSDESEDFRHYCNLRDGDKSYFIKKNCQRKWMNLSDDERGSSGINILWPNTSNTDYKKALDAAKNGESPNNISPIIRYAINKGSSFLWMGDLEKDFMEKVEDDIDLEETCVLFAPHHGRDSGEVPSSMLKR